MDSALNMAKFISSITPMSNLRLQKTMYFLEAYFLSQRGTSLFPEDFIAMDYGPVISNVYDYFKVYGRDIIPSQPINVNLSEPQKNEIIQLVNKLAEYDVYDLVYTTHKYEPWKSAPRLGVIPKQAIRKYHTDNGITLYRSGGVRHGY